MKLKKLSAVAVSLAVAFVLESAVSAADIVNTTYFGHYGLNKSQTSDSYIAFASSLNALNRVKYSSGKYVTCSSPETLKRGVGNNGFIYQSNKGLVYSSISSSSYTVESFPFILGGDVKKIDGDYNINCNDCDYTMVYKY
jgi:hypothetical protein